ncbi:hypothetical protein C8R46DRAFT_650706 [Mycena filopes]|nr:hypothetical protein C8R46DRAFT_650706 [Mycena filopes]
MPTAFPGYNDSATVMIERIHFGLDVSETMQPGYLFLCPAMDFQTGPSSFRWPDCPAYWSLDPLGIVRLSTDEATHLGFPHIRRYTNIMYQCWDTSVYAGLRQFHAAKGFDPDSQDVARHLGYPLYELCSQEDVPFVWAI